MNDLAKLASSVDDRAYQQPAQAVGQGPQATTDYYSHPADHPGNRSGSPTGTGRSKHSNPSPNPTPLTLTLTLTPTLTLTLTPSLTRRLWPLTREHLPAPLFDGYASRVAARLPWEYLLAS